MASLPSLISAWGGREIAADEQVCAAAVDVGVVDSDCMTMQRARSLSWCHVCVRVGRLNRHTALRSSSDPVTNSHRSKLVGLDVDGSVR